MAMPVRYRETLQEQCSGQMVITVNKERRLMLFPMPRWLEFEAQLAALPSLDAHAAVLQRLFVGFAQEVELDSNGRILIPQNLREVAQIDRKLVLLGQFHRFELWPKEAWADSLEDMFAQANQFQHTADPEIFNQIVM